MCMGLCMYVHVYCIHMCKLRVHTTSNTVLLFLQSSVLHFCVNEFTCHGGSCHSPFGVSRGSARSQ